MAHSVAHSVSVEYVDVGLVEAGSAVVVFEDVVADLAMGYVEAHSAFPEFVDRVKVLVRLVFAV